MLFIFTMLVLCRHLWQLKNSCFPALVSNMRCSIAWQILTRQSLDLKTQPRFCPVSLSLSMADSVKAPPPQLGATKLTIMKISKNDIKYNNTLNNDTQINKTKHNGSQYVTLSMIVPGFSPLSNPNRQGQEAMVLQFGRIWPYQQTLDQTVKASQYKTIKLIGPIRKSYSQHLILFATYKQVQ